MSKGMDRERMLNLILEAHSNCSIVMRNIILETKSEDLEYISSSLRLLNFMTDRMSAIVSLIAANLLWDAELICRSMAEAAIKLLYISLSNRDDRNVLIKEFWQDYEEVNTIKQSEMAKKTISSFDDPTYKDVSVVFAPMILNENVENELRSKWPYNKRRGLERKWSFSEMIKTISSHKEYFKVVESFLFNYMRSSHLIHADESGILIIEERKSRTLEEIEIVENSHFCDILRRTIEFKIMCSYSIAIVLGNNAKKIIDIYKSIEDVYIEMDVIISKVFEDKTYDKYKTKKA